MAKSKDARLDMRALHGFWRPDVEICVDLAVPLQLFAVSHHVAGDGHGLKALWRWSLLLQRGECILVATHSYDSGTHRYRNKHSRASEGSSRWSHDDSLTCLELNVFEPAIRHEHSKGEG